MSVSRGPPPPQRWCPLLANCDHGGSHLSVWCSHLSVSRDLASVSTLDSCSLASVSPLAGSFSMACVHTLVRVCGLTMTLTVGAGFAPLSRIHCPTGGHTLPYWWAYPPHCPASTPLSPICGPLAGVTPLARYLSWFFISRFDTKHGVLLPIAPKSSM